MRILCIFTTILGHDSIRKRITRAIERLPGVETTYVLVGPEDYRALRMPRWAAFSDPVESILVARRKARPLIEQPFDVLVLNAWELAVAFRGLVKRTPTALFLDCVPAVMDATLRRRGENGWKRRIAHQINQRSFGAIVPHVNQFLVKSSMNADSLKRDFGISAERCIVTLAPQDLHVWKPLDYTGRPGRPLRLLFVGNDLVRKGGDFLLDLYSRHLTSLCTLTIVSTDPQLAQLPSCEGVRMIPGLPRDQLIKIFQDSDLFVFPTRQDYTPEVLGEALAMGLPCLAGDVDGAQDLIRNGENGFVLPWAAPPELWVSHIRQLCENPVDLARMSASARMFAEQNLSLDCFHSQVGEVIGGFARLKEVANLPPAI